MNNGDDGISSWNEDDLTKDDEQEAIQGPIIPGYDAIAEGKESLYDQTIAWNEEAKAKKSTSSTSFIRSVINMTKSGRKLKFVQSGESIKPLGVNKMPWGATAQCSDCKDMFSVEWDYKNRRYREHSGFKAIQSGNERTYFHKCGGQINIYF